MPASPLVSVVIPTRNRTGSLERALASVEAQRYRPIEVHVVDDASDVPVAVQSRELPLHVHRRDAAGGPSVARNVGVAAAEGDYVTFLDDDDTLSPDALHSTVEWLEAHPREAVVSSWHAIVRPDGTSTSFRGPRRCRAAVLRWYDPLGALFAVVRRSAIGEEPLFDETLPTGEDWDLWLRLAERGPITVLPQTLYLYYQHEGQRVSRHDWSAAERRAFLVKHRASMSPSCVAYHECMIELSAGNRIGALRAVLVARRASAAALAMMTYLASRVGVSRRDPGLPARLLASVLRRAEAGAG